MAMYSWKNIEIRSIPGRASPRTGTYLKHELRCLKGGEAALAEKLEPVVDECLVEKQAPVFEEVS